MRKRKTAHTIIRVLRIRVAVAALFAFAVVVIAIALLRKSKLKISFKKQTNVNKNFHLHLHTNLPWLRLQDLFEQLHARFLVCDFIKIFLLCKCASHALPRCLFVPACDLKKKCWKK